MDKKVLAGLLIAGIGGYFLLRGSTAHVNSIAGGGGASKKDAPVAVAGETTQPIIFTLGGDQPAEAQAPITNYNYYFPENPAPPSLLDMITFLDTQPQQAGVITTTETKKEMTTGKETGTNIISEFMEKSGLNPDRYSENQDTKLTTSKKEVATILHERNIVERMSPDYSEKAIQGYGGGIGALVSQLGGS